ncbi:MAG: hypothetical protein F8N15_10550 [Methanobacterium sp.]|nr:hypothetical protein [Methanobacterium sp.]
MNKDWRLVLGLRVHELAALLLLVALGLAFAPGVLKALPLLAGVVTAAVIQHRNRKEWMSLPPEVRRHIALRLQGRQAA